jgi:hypothetical protein
MRRFRRGRNEEAEEARRDAIELGLAEAGSSARESVPLSVAAVNDLWITITQAHHHFDVPQRDITRLLQGDGPEFSSAVMDQISMTTRWVYSA